MPQQRAYLVVGLGNPGDDYRKTRHNVGFMVADDLAREHSISLRHRVSVADARFGRGKMAGRDVVLATPLAYMNRSGAPTARLLTYYKIRCEDLVVIHDDIDLAFGRLKIKEKGGHGGHKGVKSIMDAVGRDDFVRVRIGVGRSESGAGVSDHVLGKFRKDEWPFLERLLGAARDAVGTVLCFGAKEGMNRFNNTRIDISS